MNQKLLLLVALLLSQSGEKVLMQDVSESPPIDYQDYFEYPSQSYYEYPSQVNYEYPSENYYAQKIDLKSLFNSKVVSMQLVKRPLDINVIGGLLDRVGINHVGVLITNDQGQQWLVHTGNDFGVSSQTVVVSPGKMSSKWTSVGGVIQAKPDTTVSDLVKTGGSNYNVITNNCIEAAHRIVKKYGEK